MRKGNLPKTFCLCCFITCYLQLTSPSQCGRISYGHRFMAPESFVVSGVDDYLKSLKEKFVIVDHSIRRKTIEEQLKTISQEKGGIVIWDEELLEEITFLTEYPVSVSGRFDDTFLSLPKDLLITVLREHQRSFSI